jgi:hypothetical protein
MGDKYVICFLYICTYKTIIVHPNKITQHTNLCQMKKRIKNCFYKNWKHY